MSCFKHLPHSSFHDLIIEPHALKIQKFCTEVYKDHVLAILRLTSPICEYVVREEYRHELMHASDNSLPALIGTHSPIFIYCVV